MTAVRNAWHFIGADWRTSSGGLLVKVGEPLVHTGDLIPCNSGLHASTSAIDALSYARGPVVTLVECEGDFIDDNGDKFVCRKRTALWGYDATDELWTLARLAALEVLHFWPEAPAVVREFLETGNEDLRAAAWAAAWAAARTAAWAAAWDAARGAAWARVGCREGRVGCREGSRVGCREGCRAISPQRDPGIHSLRRCGFTRDGEAMIRALIRWWHWRSIRRKQKARRLELGRALMNRRTK